MMATSKATLDAMREGFQSYPPELRAKLLDMLCASDVESPQCWWDGSSVKRTCPLARS